MSKAWKISVPPPRAIKRKAQAVHQKVLLNIMSDKIPILLGGVNPKTVFLNTWSFLVQKLGDHTIH